MSLPNIYDRIENSYLKDCDDQNEESRYQTVRVKLGTSKHKHKHMWKHVAVEDTNEMKKSDCEQAAKVPSVYEDMTRSSQKEEPERLCVYEESTDKDKLIKAEKNTENVISVYEDMNTRKNTNENEEKVYENTKIKKEIVSDNIPSVYEDMNQGRKKKVNLDSESKELKNDKVSAYEDMNSGKIQSKGVTDVKEAANDGSDKEINVYEDMKQTTKKEKMTKVVVPSTKKSKKQSKSKSGKKKEEKKIEEAPCEVYENVEKVKRRSTFKQPSSVNKGMIGKQQDSPDGIYEDMCKIKRMSWRGTTYENAAYEDE